MPSVLLSLALLFLALSGADRAPLINSERYNEGLFGAYVEEQFISDEALVAPVLNQIKPFTACDDGSLLFIAPRGPNATAPRPYILNADGSMVWTPVDGDYGEVYNFQVQRYRGEDYLCFWGGQDTWGGHGRGKVYMFDKHYELFKTVDAGNGLQIDLHSFDIWDDGHATLTAYDSRKTKLAGLLDGPDEIYIWDSLFQEIDLSTDEVVFEWRASDHVGLDETFQPLRNGTAELPWDWFHINSVVKDKAGNYLISARYTRSILYIDGRTGTILWQLGGRRNFFHDLSGGVATQFIGQHDAKWDGANAITLFDNRGDQAFHPDNELRSRGIRVVLDLKMWTAKVDGSYYNEATIRSKSQGSMQKLPNGRVVVGFGESGVMTEFLANGSALCEVYFQPKSLFGTGGVQSYKNLKFNWTGQPLTKPKLRHFDNHLFISWLGATEVKQWIVRATDSLNGTFDETLIMPKVGFETCVDLASAPSLPRFIEAVALDSEGKHIGISEPVDLRSGEPVWDDGISKTEKDWPSFAASVVGIIILLLLGLACCLGLASTASSRRSRALWGRLESLLPLPTRRLDRRPSLYQEEQGEMLLREPRRGGAG
ncbi:hypothetical protein K470DRAFT_255793 [Piedraia hortae CBS 480.64]|uniref:Arylsulfotransferase n=1 Tax=Piedraia hortae CBS 480.64 TaxID=1314780 RepID=A0A6A7C4V0_9PEZI|nr:hypothetical protein K470DRAFT_255793 [Piedraia hortae CBS 480.64]